MSTGVVQQAGTITWGHPAVWAADGVLIDGGASTAGQINSVGLYGLGGTPLAITNLPTPAPFTGPYSQLGFGVSAASGYLTLNSFNGAAPLPFDFIINGYTAVTISPAGSFSFNVIPDGGNTSKPISTWLTETPALNVVAYGADPTGMRDSTEAIQLALDDGAGKAVFAPAGTYVITGNLYIHSGTEFFGCGVATVIKGGATWAPLPPGTQPNSAYIFLSNSGGAAIPNNDVNISIHDLSFLGDPSSDWGFGGSFIRGIGVDGFYVWNIYCKYNMLGVGIVACKNWWVENIRHTFQSGFATSVWWGSQHGVIDGVVASTDASGSGGGTVQINAADNGSAGAYTTKDITATNLSFVGVASGGSSIQIAPLGDPGGNTVKDVRVSGFYHENTGAQGGAAVIVSGVCSGITIEQGTIVGGPAANPTGTNTNPAIAIVDEGTAPYYPSGVTIRDIEFRNWLATSTNGLIGVFYCSGCLISGITQAGCNYDYVVYAYPGASGVVVSDNLCPAGNVGTLTGPGFATNRFDNGVQFGPSGAALSNYTVGTWTPALLFGGAATGITYSSQVGTIVHLGVMVYATVDITLTSKGSATGAVTITGLPVSEGGPETGPALLSSYAANLVSVTGGLPFCTVSAQTIALFQPNAGAALTDANFANTSIIRIAGWYRTA